MATVVLSHVTKKFSGKTTAVDDLSITVADKEFLVLVGPSGCGKSTTLRLIAGLENLSDGEIKIGDRVVNDIPPKDRDIAMVFQNYALYPHMSVYKNMAFGLQLRFGGGILNRGLIRLFRPHQAAELSAARKGIDDQVRQAAVRLEIEHLLDRKPHQLSGGERQRVALGRAIVREPAAFLFDEPLSNLDAKLRQQMRVELKRLHHELNATMIYVTHDQTEAMTLGDRVAVMNDGKVQQIAPPMEIYEQPENLFVARFIGNTPMNLETGKLFNTEGKIEFRSDRLRLRLNSKLQTAVQQKSQREQVTLGFRAEAVNLAPAELTGTNTTHKETKNQGSNCELDNGKTTATVVTIDQLGDSAIAYLSLVGQTNETLWTAKLDRDHRLKTGDTVQTTIRPEYVHLFDTDTGNNILKD